MGFLGKMFGTAAGETVKGTLEGIGGLAKDIRTAITGDISPDKKADLLEKANELESRVMEGQIKVGIAEAQNKHVFVSGARPYIIWVAGTSIGMYFIPQYFMAAILWTRACWLAKDMVAFPIAEPAGLIELVGLLLGLGALRTVEGLKGVKNS